MDFLSGWFKRPISKIGFEDVKYALTLPHSYIFINTLPENMQECLIPGTILARDEVTHITHLLDNRIAHKKTFVLYGKNASDESAYKKYDQLLRLGIEEVHVYSGGMFEWLLLQEIYGPENFATTAKADLLKYREPKRLDLLRLA